MKHWIMNALWFCGILSLTFVYGYNTATKAIVENSCQPSITDIGTVLHNAQNPEFDYGEFLHRNGENLIVEKQLNEIYISANKFTRFKEMPAISNYWDTKPSYKYEEPKFFMNEVILISESPLDAYVRANWVVTNQEKV